jgi:hypothetical protein
MLLTMAQAAVTEKYRQYEELASRDGSRFHPDVWTQAREPVSPGPLAADGGGQRHEKPVLMPGE